MKNILRGFPTLLCLIGVSLLLLACGERRQTPGDEIVESEVLSVPQGAVLPTSQELQNLISGKDMVPTEKGKSSRVRDGFHANGEWEGVFTGIDITLDRGSWKIEPLENGGSHVIVTTSEVYGEKLNEPRKTCLNILPNEHDDTALLWHCSGRAFVTKVRFTHQND